MLSTICKMLTRAIDSSILKPVNLLLGLILAFYFFNGVYYLKSQSLTFDEESFLHYAVRLVKGYPDRIYPQKDNSKMPVVVVNLIPRAVNQLINPGLKKTDNGASDVFAGRYVTLIISLFIILLVFRWSKQLYGEWAGLFSAFLISFCPDMIANAGLVTTDTYSMLFLTLTMYYFWKYCNNTSYGNFIIFSICIAFSQLAKQSLIHLYIFLPFISVIWYFKFKPDVNWRSVGICIVSFVFINWLIINLGFYFRDTNTSLGNYHFVSNTFLSFQQLLPKWLPLPFPKAFITGLDLSKYYDQIGGGNYIQSSFGKVTILGKSSTGGSFWYYYIISFLFKTTISHLIFITAGLILIVKNRKLNDFVKNELFLLTPVIYYGLYMSFFYKTQIGIRQFIFVYPFLFIICGSIIPWLKGFYPRLAITFCSIFLIISVLRYWANYFPYTNEFITDKKMAYRYVGSSNLEFDQSRFFFADYLRAHPEVSMAPRSPRIGVFLITLHNYMDIWNLHEYDWIRGIPPSGQVAFNGLLIKVTDDDLKHLSEYHPE